MANKEKDEIVETTIKKFDDLINYDYINKMIKTSELDTEKKVEISQRVVRNIAKWALNGDSDKDIADNLDISVKQFELLCNICPVLVMVMRDSRAMADIIVSGSLIQTAIGGQKIRKQQPVKLGVYEDGVKVGEEIKIVEVEEELPPNPMLLKFIAEHKLSEKFGEKEFDNNKAITQVVDNLTPEQIKALENYAKDN